MKRSSFFLQPYSWKTYIRIRMKLGATSLSDVIETLLKIMCLIIFWGVMPEILKAFTNQVKGISRLIFTKKVKHHPSFSGGHSYDTKTTTIHYKRIPQKKAWWIFFPSTEAGEMQSITSLQPGYGSEVCGGGAPEKKKKKKHVTLATEPDGPKEPWKRKENLTKVEIQIRRI